MADTRKADQRDRMKNKDRNSLLTWDEIRAIAT